MDGCMAIFRDERRLILIAVDRIDERFGYQSGGPCQVEADDA